MCVGDWWEGHVKIALSHDAYMEDSLSHTGVEVSPLLCKSRCSQTSISLVVDTTTAPSSVELCTSSHHYFCRSWWGGWYTCLWSTSK